MEKIALYGKFSENMLNALKAKCPEGFETYLVKPDDDLALLADADYMVNRGGVVNAASIAARSSRRTAATVSSTTPSAQNSFMSS